MATTIASSTLTDGVFQYPNIAHMDRSSNGTLNGQLYVLVPFSANVWTLYMSSNQGSTWTSMVSFTRANIVQMGGIFIDNLNYLHVVYRTNESSQDRLYYNRVNLSLTVLAWETEFQVVAAGNGGVAGATYTGFDFVVGLGAGSNGSLLTGWSRILIALGWNNSGSTTAMTLLAVGCVTNSGVKVNQPSLISPHNTFTTGVANGTVGVSMDLEHTGDARSSTVANLWICWGRNRLEMIKAAWNGTGWNVPSGSTIITSSMTNTIRSPVGRFTGHPTAGCFAMAIPSVGSTSAVQVYARNRANTATSALAVTPNHPQGVITSCGISYNYKDGSLRVFAVGTTLKTLYYVDYIASAWGSWTLVNATAITGTTWDNWGVRRGLYGNQHYDCYDALATPVQQHNLLIYPYAPNTPTWNAATSSAPVLTYQNGAAADVNSSLILSWNFTDTDPTDTQSAYAVSRQIGAGTLAYWRASDSTWQVAEVQNTSGSTTLTLASGWAAGSDAAYTYKVKYWDSSSTPSAAYSAAFIVVPSVKVNPTITVPTNSAVISGNALTLTWTVAEQKSYRIRIASAGVTVYDSGKIDDALTASLVVNYTLVNNTLYTLTLNTWNLEGLSSVDTQVTFSTFFTPPATPTLVNTPNNTTGNIQVAVTNPGGSGLATFVAAGTSATGNGSAAISPALPAGVQADDAMLMFVSSRRWTSTVLNPSFDVNTTSWVGTATFFVTGVSTLARIVTDFAPLDNPIGACCDVTYAGGAAVPGISQTITLVASTTYAFSAWVKVVSGTSVTINARDTTNSVTGTPSSAVVAGAGWTLVSGTITTGATATPSIVFSAFAGSTTASEFYVDEFRIATATPAVPAGWLRVCTYGPVAVFGRYYVAGDAAPSVTFTNGLTNEDVLGQIVAFRGGGIAPSALAAQANVASTSITWPSLTIAKANQVVLITGWMQDDWTSVATLAGCTEIAEITSTAGNDSGQVWDYAIQTIALNVTGTTFVVTGGTSQQSIGMIMALDPRPVVTNMDIYRRVAGDGTTGIRIATGIAVNSTYLDYTATSGVNYEYEAIVTGANGTTTSSVWTA